MNKARIDSRDAVVAVQRRGTEGGRVTRSRIDGVGATKMYVGLRPRPAGSFEDQVRECYRHLGDLLTAEGAAPSNVVSEKAFFSDLPNQVEGFRALRSGFYSTAVSDPSAMPATTYLHQPPCEPGVLFELQARVLFPRGGEEMTVRPIEGLREPAVGKVVSYRGYHHLYLHNLTGGVPGDGMSYGRQMQDVFESAERILESEGLTFREVIRTWIYLEEMERDYDELNRVRNDFFQRAGVERMPASTGIKGGVYPSDRGGSMDLYALRTDRPVDVRLMHAPTLNEAWSYGSAFARGMAVTREDRTIIYMSGTASIDTRGEVVHVGDIEGQVRRMLINVEELLAGSGARPSDVIRATTYLKNAGDHEIFRRVFAEREFPLDIPHTVCNADVCRPAWLVEIEVAAILPPVRSVEP